MTHAPPATALPEQARFIERLRASLADGSFSRLVLGRPQGQPPTLEKLLVRRVLLRGQPHLALVWRHRTQDITKNLPLDEAVQHLAMLLESAFQHAHLQTRTHDIQLTPDRKGRWGLRVGRLAPAVGSEASGAAQPAAASAPTAAATSADAPPAAEAATPPGDGDAGPYLGQNRARQHPLSLGLPFLAELGITDARQQLVPAMARKWRQINKFVEVLGHAMAQSALAGRNPAEPVRVLDFGAGKGYLTFAVHQHLVASGRSPEVTGVELRTELTALCNEAVGRLGLAGLRFEAGDVRSHPAAATDIMIALHACDTATDVALHRGVQAGAAIILCSPCCHQELRPQLRWPAVLAPLLRHGIHQATQAEMLTDALRALLLQTAGYDTRVFEFISPEQTSKNRMVLAVRRSSPLPAARQAELQAELQGLKDLFGVRHQTLETLLRGDAAAPAPG